ncbi:Hsp70 family protein [Kitasatospora purpeofusca]|uniref:Hsp70 family protein n=1 Tax=Kitasatospora purpeofusca TaxID=67352 RepID=UPI00367B373F
MFKPRVVAAIDFGTHGSGFAWTVMEEGNQDARHRRINFCNRWDAQPVACPKNLSALLVNNAGDVVAWGFDARRKWTMLRADRSTPGGLAYHAAFKMDLMPVADGTNGLPDADEEDQDVLEGDEGKGQFAEPGDSFTPGLVTEYLRQLYRRALEHITGSGYDEDEIRWCLTVPAIWTDYLKMVMRECARNAGMPSEDGRLLLALEPEAAAHYARVSGVCVGPGNEESANLMAPGARFMVVDCGGGTVDITAYRNDHGGRMVEIGRANGGRLGSDYLNRAFEEQLLVSRFGNAEVLARLKVACPEALLDLVDAWERAKLHITADQDDPIYLNIPAMVDRRLDPEARKRLSRIQDGIDDAIVVSPDEVRAIFDNVVPDILGRIEEQYSVMRACSAGDDASDVILLAGGFGTSPYLQQVVRERFEGRATVLVPPDPSIAVLFGAVHFCYEPHTRARRSRFTYGCRTVPLFQRGVDRQEYRFRAADGRVRCRNRFSVLVSAGDTVDSDAEVIHVYHPIGKSQNALTLQLFATSDPEPRYVTGDGCDEVGSIRVDLGKVMRFPVKERGVRLHMRFGETEIRARAIVMRTGEEIEATVRFHSNY